MKYHLRHIDFIDKNVLEQLNSLSIQNTDNLIEAANTKTKRKSLVLETGISLEEIEFMASISDLVRIKGVAVKTAIKLIQDCSFKCVQDIAHFNILNVHSNKQPETTILEEKLANCSISKSQFLEIAEEADELKPRLVFDNVSEKSELNNKFISELKKQINTSGKWTTKSLFFAFGLVFIAALVILAIAFYPIYQKYQTLNELYQPFIEAEPFMPAFWLKVLSLIGYTLIFIVIIVLFLCFWQLIQKWFKLLIYRFLFRRSVFKGIFLKIDYLDLINKHKKSSKLMVFIALLFIISVLAIFIVKGIEGINYLLVPIIILLVFMIVVLYYNTYRFYVKIKNIQRSAWEVYQRIQFASQIEILFTIFLLIIGLNVVFPFALDAIQVFEKEIVIEASHRKYQEALEKINFNEIDPDIVENVKETLENVFIMRSTFIIHEDGMESLRSIFHEFPGFILSILAAISVALILSFSIPYFKFTGVRSGITFLFVIGISMIASFIVEKKFSGWFFIEEGQSIRYLFIFIFSFWFAILFDWLYRILSFRKQECPNCRTLIEKHFNFCPNCGLIKN